jgi:hypothetical protein
MPEASACHFRVGSRAGSNPMFSRDASLRRSAHSSVIGREAFQSSMADLFAAKPIQYYARRRELGVFMALLRASIQYYFVTEL